MSAKVKNNKVEVEQRIRRGTLKNTRDLVLKWTLITIVVTYVLILVGAPLVAIIYGAFSNGITGFLNMLTDPLAQTALILTLELSAAPNSPRARARVSETP